MGVKGDKVKLRTMTRRQRVVELRRDGKTLAAIGAELGINKSNVSRLLHQAFKAVPTEAVEEIRGLLAARYERVHEVASERLASKNDEVALQAASVITRNARNESALFGLESSELRLKASPVVHDGGYDYSRLTPDELCIFHGLLEKLRGEAMTTIYGDALARVAAAEAYADGPPPIALLVERNPTPEDEARGDSPATVTDPEPPIELQ